MTPEASAVRLVDVEPAHRTAALALFRRVFGHDMSLTQREWKYGGGRGVAVGAMLGAELVGHYGGVSRAIRYFGRPERAIQICDLMVAPEGNRSLRRRGPMVWMAERFLEQQVGFGRPHLVDFGFPSRRAFEVSRKTQLHARVDEILRASWLPERVEGTRLPRHEAIELDAAGRLTATQRRSLERLWQRMARALRGSVLGVRDPAWLLHRYLQHPSLRYELHLVHSRSWWRRPLAALVLRQHADRLEVMDLVGAPADFGPAITLARHWAAERGLAHLDVWVTASHAELLHRAAPKGWSVVPADIVVPANIHTPGPAQALEHHWFLLTGDADYT